MLSAPPFRRLAARLVILWALCVFALGQPAAWAQQAVSHPLVAAVDAVGMTVSDIDRSIEFYEKVLTFEKVSDVEVAGTAYEHLQGVFGVRMRVVRMRLGGEFIELTKYLAPRGRPTPVDSRSHDRWFQHIAIIVSHMDRAYQRLRQHKVRHLSTGPQRLPDWNKNAAGIKAFYFADPDGHPLEILQFPSDKGDPKWHRPTDNLFLGIDHTAIVVGDTDASLTFYRDTLGLKVAGRSENYGTEQEHLNQVFGARLRITALKVERGPGIEFLEYIAPPGGRDLPADAKANDLLFWNTQLVVEDFRQVANRLHSAGTRFVSKPSRQIQAQIVRDPDGHALQLNASGKFLSRN